MTEIDISKVSIDGDIATIMGVRYQRIEPQSFYDKLWELLHSKIGDNSDTDEITDRIIDLIKEEYPYKKHTLKETEKSLKESFREVQQTEEWIKIQKLIDEEDNDKNFKNSLKMINEWGEKNKPPTLYSLIEDWWCDVFCANFMDDMETCIDNLVSKIDTDFIPASSDSNTYDWERCLKRMREKLR